MKMTDRRKIGEVGVDSGTLMIIDPCYIDDAESAERLSSDRIQDLVDEVQAGTVAGGLGLIFRSGLGDGIYEVFATYTNNTIFGERIAKVEIILIEEEDREGD
jgi:hypothetical protein